MKSTSKVIELQQDVYDAFMLDHATSALPCALMVAGDLHVHLSPQGALAAGIWDAVGGALIEKLAGDEGTGITRKLPRKRAHTRVPAAKLMACDKDKLRWRRGLSGVRHARTGIRGGDFMRLEPGQAVPTHGHSALEATIVLSGALSVDDQVYSVGDLVLGVPGERHKPAAAGDEACICYVGRAPKPFWRLS